MVESLTVGRWRGGFFPSWWQRSGVRGRNWLGTGLRLERTNNWEQVNQIPKADNKIESQPGDGPRVGGQQRNAVMDIGEVGRMGCCA